MKTQPRGVDEAARSKVFELFIQLRAGLDINETDPTFRTRVALHREAGIYGRRGGRRHKKQSLAGGGVGAAGVPQGISL